jgi:hypothetical protein
VVTVSGPIADPSRPVGASDRRGASRKPRAAPWANEFDPFGVEEMRNIKTSAWGVTATEAMSSIISALSRNVNH